MINDQGKVVISEVERMCERFWGIETVSARSTIACAVVDVMERLLVEFKRERALNEVHEQVRSDIRKWWQFDVPSSGGNLLDLRGLADVRGIHQTAAQHVQVLTLIVSGEYRTDVFGCQR